MNVNSNSLRHNICMEYIWLSTLRQRQNRRHFADDIFKCIFFFENVWISLKISLRFVPNGPINNISALVQIMAWRRPGDKPLSEPMVDGLLTHICVTRPQWVNPWVPNPISTLNMLNCFKDYKRCIHILYHILFLLGFFFLKEDQIHSGTLHVAYPILPIPCVLMPWQLKEPGHQQAWYWPNKLEYYVQHQIQISDSK